MTRHEVCTDYSKLSDSELPIRARSVYSSLTGNPNFTFEAEVIPNLKVINTDYETKLTKAQNGTSADIIAKNASRRVLSDALREIALEVNRQAKGDLSKLQTTGFTIAKDNKKVGTLPKPEGLKVTGGENIGDVLVSVDANSNANVYNFYSAPVPAPANMTEWRLTPSTTRKKNISGFTPGKEYEFRCAYQGADETLVYSDSVRIFAH